MIRSRLIPRALIAATVFAALGGCAPGADQPLASMDSYLLLAPVEGGRSPGGLPIVRELAVSDPRAQPFANLFSTGFASEMLRTVYLAKQFVRSASFDGHGYPDLVRKQAADPVCLIVGAPADSFGHGLALPRFLGAPVERPDTRWLAFTDAVRTDRAAVQTIAGRLAPHALGFVIGERAPSPLVTAYTMAMEVIAREWRVISGPKGVVPFDAGTAEQRKLFADIRENRLVLTQDAPDRRALRAAEAIVTDERVGATVLYRLAQTKGVGQRIAPAAFYAPFNLGRMPAGVSPAAVLGSFRNFQAKLLGAWGKAVLTGHAPMDVIDLIDRYVAEFPAEKGEVIRIFLVTTFGATIKPGGVSIRPQDSRAALDELTVLAADVVAGRRTVRDALAVKRSLGK